ncbi:hypothetical protein PHMEG_00014650 [Phytophthora megakarya]|uniref:Uncharacterized protein n=1 Tax=Phytophthora megakarya TaxID=4795 RepID=A0A225W4B4_9STRA|nr:hypothetical protein PHMEG_00014650 [Phytophthora megakarya]
MLGFQYVVAKSREFSSAVERELSAASNQAPEAASLSGRNEGEAFLRAQQTLYGQAVSSHQKLMQSGQELDAALSHTRATLQAQAASEQFLAQNFHLVSRVRQQLAGVRSLVLKLAEEADEVENLLVQRYEEDAARQNAVFAAKQQQELEKFEAEISKESEGRKREMLEMRRQKLARAFMNDLRTYQTLVAHHGDEAATEARVVNDDKEQVSLDEVDLVVTADPEQLAAFYDSGSEQEEEAQSPTFSSPPVPKELEEEEEKEGNEDDERDGDDKGEKDEEATEVIDQKNDEKAEEVKTEEADASVDVETNKQVE